MNSATSHPAALAGCRQGTLAATYINPVASIKQLAFYTRQTFKEDSVEWCQGRRNNFRPVPRGCTGSQQAEKVNLGSNGLVRLTWTCSVQVAYGNNVWGRQMMNDDELFDNVLINSGHVLYSILPRETVSTYAFRRRRHNRELTSKTTHLEQCSFIVRMLYKDMY